MAGCEAANRLWPSSSPTSSVENMDDSDYIHDAISILPNTTFRDSRGMYLVIKLFIKPKRLRPNLEVALKSVDFKHINYSKN